MLLSDLLSLVDGFRGEHFGAIFGSLLLCHQLAAVDFFLLVSREREPNRQRQGSS
jgi:hypothetical protein